MSELEGRVQAVCISAMNSDEDLLKFPQPSVEVGPFGFNGDRHAGAYRTKVVEKRGSGYSLRFEVDVFNDRQVTVVSREVVDEISRDLGISIAPGGLGENVLVEGLGDLSSLSLGDELRFRGGVRLRIMGQNEPCVKINRYHGQVVKKIHGRRGVLAMVTIPGKIEAGDGVIIVRRRAEFSEDKI